MISRSKSKYSYTQNPASERSERAINMSKTVNIVILSYFFVSVDRNRLKMTESDKSFFSNFFEITEIDSKLVLKNMHVIFPNVSVMDFVILKNFGR